MRRIRFSLLLLPLLAFSAPAQSVPAPAAPTTQITLGQSIVALHGSWKFHIGDLPIDPQTGRPAWVEPDFDDSQWETVDLTPQTGSFDPRRGSSGYVPGWTAKGHPGYWGYAWYRIRVRVAAVPGEKLAVAGPSDVDDGYQVFANGRLLGRGHTHATCLALRIAADGAVTLANAGHLPPYLNGKELPMEGAMPLGIIEHAEFSVMQFRLNENDRLMLMSDGVAEAQDEDGHLFGFERILAMLQQPITAAEVATAAQNFGQQDDISVLRIVRDAMPYKLPSFA